MKFGRLAAVIALTIASTYAFAQTSTPGADLDAVNAAQDAAISDNSVKNSEQDAGLSSVNDGLSSLNDLVKSIDESVKALAKKLDDHINSTLPPPPPPPELPKVSISVSPLSASEGASYAFLVSRSGDLSAPSSVEYVYSGAADASDFVSGLPSGVASLGVGQSSLSISVATNNDQTVESDESFTLTLQNPSGAVLDVASASAIIANDDVLPPPPPSTNTLSLDSSVKFQTISGWEVTTRSWEQDKVADRYDGSYIAAAPEMVADVVNEIGVNRIRLEIQSGAENPIDYWAQFTSGALSYTEFKAKYYSNINDNADPFTANSGGFKWSQLDEKMDALVMPMRAALAAKGEKLFINLNVVDFASGDLGNLVLASQPEEYAEFVVEALKHLKSKYGVTPDSLEIILEPENSAPWDGTRIGEAIKATKARMAANGFALQIIAPSTLRASAAIPHYDAIKATGAKADVLSFHTYGMTDDTTISAIGAKGKSEGIQTAMLEKIGADINQFYRDVTLANVSAWQQWGLASKVDNGNYLLVADLTAPLGSRTSMASRTRELAQIWRHVRSGYVRIGASTNFAGVRALAFEAPSGGKVAVAVASNARSFSITGLPAGSYGVEYTTDTALSVKVGTFTVAAGASLPVSIPAAGVLVAYPVGVVTPPPPPPPPPSNGTLTPNTADGLPILQLNLGHHIYWGGEIPYKNLRLLYPEYGDKSKIEAGKSDPTTGWIYMEPGEKLILGRTRPHAANGINTDPGEYVLKASIKSGSTATIHALGFVDNGSSGLVIRKTDFLDDQDLNGGQVELQGGASGGWIKVDYWGPTKWENDPLGWHPEFLKDVSQYKILRFLDWTSTNGSNIVAASEWIDDTDDKIHSCTNCAQFPTAANNHLRKAGYSFGRIFDLVNKADAAAHINIPITMGAGAIKSEITTCMTPVSGGQVLIRNAIAANWPAIEAGAKVEYRLLADKIARSAVNQNYPDDRVLLIELGNELWNYGNKAFGCSSAYADGVGQVFYGSPEIGHGVGHLAVIAFDAFKKSFAQIKPNQELKFVIGVQTMGSTSRIKFAAREFDRYAAEIGVDPKIRLETFIATTGYYSGGWQWNKNRSPGALNNPFGVSTEAEFNAAFAAADQDGSLFSKVKAWYFGPLSNNVNIARLITQHTTWRDYAINNGWRGIIQYEGSPADAVGKAAGQLGGDYPASLAAWQRWVKSQEAYDVQAEIIRQLSAINPMNPAVTTGWRPSSLVVSNYGLIARDLNYGSPWMEKTVNDAGVCLSTGSIGAWCEYKRN